MFVIVIVEQTIEAAEPKPEMLLNFARLREGVIDQQTLRKELVKYSLGLFPATFL